MRPSLRRTSTVTMVMVISLVVFAGPVDAASRPRARSRVAAAEQRQQEEARRRHEAHANRLAEVLFQEEQVRRAQATARQAAAQARLAPPMTSATGMAAGQGFESAWSDQGRGDVQSTPGDQPAADTGFADLFGGRDARLAAPTGSYPSAIVLPDRAATVPFRLPASVDAPSVGMDVFNDAYSRFSRGDLEQARMAFARFRDSNPGHDMSDNAQYWVGECYAAQGRQEEAIAAYQVVLDHFPFGDKVADALLKSAYVLLDLDRTAEARVRLEQVVEEFPGTGLASRAAARLDGLSSE